jgi:hypothetical protein
MRIQCPRETEKLAGKAICLPVLGKTTVKATGALLLSDALCRQRVRRRKIMIITERKLVLLGNPWHSYMASVFMR